MGAKNQTQGNINYSSRTGYIRWIVQGIAFFFASSLIAIFLLASAYRWINPNLTWLMVERYFCAEKTKLQPPNRIWVSIDNISPQMVLAAIAAEDNLFLIHRGFDLESIEDAREQRKMGKRIRGASTISMQVSKNLFLWHGRTWTRKVLEAGFTVIIETLWSKERIMEIYLNIAEFGPAIYGIEAATRHYYNKPSAELKRNEAAMIATVLPNPLKRNPVKPSQYMLNYQQRIKRNMSNLGEINFGKI